MNRPAQPRTFREILKRRLAVNALYLSPLVFWLQGEQLGYWFRGWMS